MRTRNTVTLYYIVYLVSFLYFYRNLRFLCYEDLEILIFNDILRFI